MKIINSPAPIKINEFISQNPGVSGAEFLLSSFWAELLAREGKEVKYLAVESDLADGEPKTLVGEFLALILIVKQPLWGENFYWYAPRGPLLNKALSPEKKLAVLKFLFTAIVRLESRSCFKPGALFLKIEPANQDLDFKAQNFKQKTFSSVLKIIPSSDIQPRRTLVLDLKKSPEELLSAMHQKTRYNIRLAERKGVQITKGDINDFAEFWRLMKITGKRDAFRLHNQEHYQNLLKPLSESGENLGTPGAPVASGALETSGTSGALATSGALGALGTLETSGALGALGTLETSGALGAGKNFIRLFFAEYEGRKIATALVSSFARKATYLHGASDNEYRQLMAPQLLQWEIIKTMKAEGANLYDFYGIDEQKWPGVTRFKQGFGGEERVYNGVYDLILRPVRYGFYRLLKSLRRLIKG